MNIQLLKVIVMFIVPFIVVMVPVYLGQRWGILHSKKVSGLENAPVGTVVGAAFGLLAFMIAFIFQIAANRYDSRKELLLDEVTNIRTLYLRAGLVPEPIKSETKKLLVEYVDLHLVVFQDTAKLDEMLSGTQNILDTLWGFAEDLAKEDRSSEVYSLYTTSVNDIIDNYNKRITWTFEYRFPPAVLWILFIIAFFTMLILGYQFGISGKGTLRVNVLLAIIFGVVMVLILALDRPDTGMARLNQKPMITLQKQLRNN
jgi:hypothetical protein